MVKHVVIFKLKKEVSPEERKSAMQAFKAGIEALPAAIGFIKDIEVGLNINGSEECDICLNSLFATLDDVKTYAAHPAHKAVAGALAPYIAARSCVDYEI